MPKQIRIAALVFGAIGLTLMGGLWALAGLVALARPSHGITAGFGRDGGSLVNLRVDSDGTLWVQHFPKNLSTRLGPYVGVSRSASLKRGPVWLSLWPRTSSDVTSWRLYWHIGPFAFVSVALLGFAVIPAGLRRRYRRRHGLCLNCGYDLRGAVSDRCTECGHNSEAVPTPRSG